MVKLDKKVRRALNGGMREHVDPIAHVEGCLVVARLQVLLPPGCQSEDDLKFQFSGLQGCSHAETLGVLEAALAILRTQVGVASL